MKLKVVLNKDIAFSNYLRTVINLERRPWLKGGPLKKIPLKLSRKAKEFGWPLEFSFEKHPTKDLNEYIKEFKRIIKQAEKFHNQDWQKHQKELKKTAGILREIACKHGDFIIKTISQITRNKWQYSDIWLVPSIYYGGTIVDNKIFAGYEERTKENFYTLVIHELFHANEPSREKMRVFMNKLKLPTDSKEIATVLLTNKAIDRLNKKFNLNIRNQRFHTYYRESIAKLEPELKQLSGRIKSFSSMVISVDKFLTKKKYRGYYSQYNR